MKEIFTQSDNFKSEYSCAVVKVGELTPIEGSDFLAKTNVFGTQIVVRKDQVKEGDLLVYAANETQLNSDFLKVNNLYEIGCREMNANAEEVAKIMAEYEPIKAEADRKRNEAKQIKSKMESYTNKANKSKKYIKKLEAQLKDADENEAVEIRTKLNEQNEFVTKYTTKAMALTTPYTNLKKEIEDIVKSGEHIIAEAKKHCGFFNKYGRVRCLTLKNTASFGVLFAPEDLIKFDNTITIEDVLAYEGKEFDTVNGELFVKAYVPPVKEQPQRGNGNKAQNKLKRFDRMIDGEFYFHYNTEQLQKYMQNFQPDDIVDISVKRHGTSIIIGNLHVKEQLHLPIYKRIWNRIADLLRLRKFIDYEVKYGPIFSSRTVIKNKYINSEVKNGYYSKDVWTEYGEIIYPYLDPGMTVYGEICGYVTGSESMIQKLYDYGCDKGENNIMFYRITSTNIDGSKFEWDVPEVKDWTEKLISRMQKANDENWKKIHPIDLLYHGTLEDLYPIDTENHWHENVLEALKVDKERFGMEENEPLCTHFDVPREGICIRKYKDPELHCYKLKTMSFSFGEAIRMDQGDVDVEMAEGYTEG